MMDRTTVNVSTVTRDRLNNVRRLLASNIGRPMGNITHDEAIRSLLDEHDQAVKVAEAEAP